MNQRVFLRVIVCLAVLLTHIAPCQASDFFALCIQGTAEQIRQALENGADVNARDADGYTPLMLAVGAKHGVNPNAEIVRLLIRHGADVRAEYKNHAIDIEKYSVDTATALHWAVQLCPEVVPDLLDAGADIDAPSYFIGTGTPLLIAVTRSKEHPEVVSLLLQRGADVNVECRPLGTALSVALSMVGVMRVSSEAAQELIYAGADVRYINPSGATMLICAMDGDNRDSNRIIQTMLDAGVDVNAADENETTALMMAAIRGASPETLRILLKVGADAGMRDSNGFTAYRHAQYNNNIEMANVIFYKGSALQLFIAKVVYPMLLALPVLLLAILLFRRYVQDITVRNREIAVAVFLVISLTFLHLFVPKLPLPAKINIQSQVFLLPSSVYAGIAWRKRQNISSLEFYAPQILLILMCVLFLWTSGSWGSL